MRIWNGLKLKDIVLYNNKKYIVINLYIKDNKRLCDLVSLDNEQKNIINEIIVYECKKL